MDNLVVIKVKNEAEPNKVAGSIASMIKENKSVVIQAVGAGAVNQAVKAIAITRGVIAPLGINLSCIPAFTDVEIMDETRTGIKFILKEDK